MNIYDDKNAVIFGVSLTPRDLEIVPMGSLYDSLEYFMKIYEYNKDVFLLLHLSIHYDGITDIFKQLNGKFDFIYKQLKVIIKSKYNISDYSFFNNIHIVDLKKVFWTNHLRKILTLDLMSPRFFNEFIARAKDGVFIVSELTSPEYFYKSKINQVTYYSEMPFCYSDIDYRLKYDFEKWKPINSFKKQLYINYPKQDPFKNPKIKDIINSFNKSVLIKEKQFLYDLHKHFDEYLYFQSNKWFDTHPKLFHECKYYNKPYHYYNWKGIKDGAYYRYKYSLDDDLKKLQLSKNDPIIQRMIN